MERLEAEDTPGFRDAMSPTAAPPNPPPGAESPRQVSRFEFNLIRVLRFFLGHFPSDQGLQLLRSASARPECLSPTAVDLVQDSLAKGCVLFLVRAGGWRNERYLRDGKPIAGRVWERCPIDERTLEFSRHVVDFLVWATAEKVHETAAAWDAPAAALTPADELFFWLAFDACRADPDLANVLRRKQAFRSNPLCWLAFPSDVADRNEAAPPAFEPSLSGLRAVVLECLQPHFAGRWLRSERGKGQIGDWEKMRQQGRAESASLQAFLKAAGAANRLDLARFILNANAALFQSELTPIFWTGGLQGSGPMRLADRLDTQRGALALPRQMDVLAAWHERARSIGYFDDDYAASQLWKHDWEAADGDRIAERARAAVQMLEPLRTGTTPQPAAPDHGASAAETS
jgi:hypothetical protein